MGQIIVRNLDDAVIERLKAAARAKKISLEQHARDLLAAGTMPSREAVLAEVDRIRATTRGKVSADSTALVREDRDRR